MNTLLPALVASKHDDYLKAFTYSGEGSMIDRVRIQMIVDS